MSLSAATGDPSLMVDDLAPSGAPLLLKAGIGFPHFGLFDAFGWDGSIR